MSFWVQMTFLPPFSSVLGFRYIIVAKSIVYYCFAFCKMPWHDHCLSTSEHFFSSEYGNASTYLLMDKLFSISLTILNDWLSFINFNHRWTTALIYLFQNSLILFLHTTRAGQQSMFFPHWLITYATEIWFIFSGKCKHLFLFILSVNYLIRHSSSH